MGDILQNTTDHYASRSTPDVVVEGLRQVNMVWSEVRLSVLIITL